MIGLGVYVWRKDCEGKDVRMEPCIIMRCHGSRCDLIPLFRISIQYTNYPVSKIEECTREEAFAWQLPEPKGAREEAKETPHALVSPPDLIILEYLLGQVKAMEKRTGLTPLHDAGAASQPEADANHCPVCESCEDCSLRRVCVNFYSGRADAHVAASQPEAVASGENPYKDVLESLASYRFCQDCPVVVGCVPDRFTQGCFKRLLALAQAKKEPNNDSTY